ncbi:sodium/glutamate symporter [Desulfonatronovibrio hydrogenovorans]|uniref:sodium/glutamate symporter n=1 Tax=Desulfonatronovibrio hydrogenovorans TaxID=53245 RepID=UPI0004912A86|nr:sodium/glutamate symporter [Desulfonatronovibrio hydrogenovorans]
MNLEQIFYALIVIGILLLVGKMIRRRIKAFQKLFIPASIIAGILGLLLGEQVLGSLTATFITKEHWIKNGLFPDQILEVWSGLPGLLISAVFASLFIGKKIPPLKDIWHKAGPMVAHGQTLAWGQYVIGITLALVFLTPIWGISPLSGALIEISFEGGHGTAAGLAETFKELGFADGADLALALATMGVVMGTLLGILLINWGVRSGRIHPPGKTSTKELEELAEHDERESQQLDIEKFSAMTEPLSLHLSLVGLAIGVGWIIHQGLMWTESVFLSGSDFELMRHVPLFPLAMIGGVFLQIILDRTGYSKYIDRKLINRISGAALDILIVSALATLSVKAVGANIQPFLILAGAGILWNLFGFLVLAPLMFPRDWFARGMGNFGQCMGMTVIGLLLMRIVDPDNRTGAMESFGYKQLLFEPVVGGGLFTAASLPLIYQFGPVPVLILTSGLTLFWLIFGLVSFRQKKKEKPSKDAP